MFLKQSCKETDYSARQLVQLFRRWTLAAWKAQGLFVCHFVSIGNIHCNNSADFYFSRCHKMADVVKASPQLTFLNWLVNQF